MFEIVITEIKDSNTQDQPTNQTERIERFKQTLDTLDINKVIHAINKPVRVRKAKNAK